MIATDHRGDNGVDLEAGGAIEVLLIAIVIALIVWVACKLLHREDIGNPAAAVIVVIGALFALLTAL